MTNQQTTLNETITDSSVEQSAFKARVVAIEKEKDEDITKKYGLVTQQVKSYKVLGKKWVIIFIICFFYRRLISAICVFTIYSYPCLQAIFALFINLLYMAILMNLRPYRSRSDLVVELINQAACLTTVYFLLIFSGDYIFDGKVQNQIGITLISLTCINFVINFIPILLSIKEYIRQIMWRCKKKKAKTLVFPEK